MQQEAKYNQKIAEAITHKMERSTIAFLDYLLQEYEKQTTSLFDIDIVVKLVKYKSRLESSSQAYFRLISNLEELSQYYININHRDTFNIISGWNIAKTTDDEDCSFVIRFTSQFIDHLYNQREGTYFLRMYNNQ